MLTPTAPGLGPVDTGRALGTQQDVGDKTIFLKLLVAQMQNQDPLNPQDPTQMSAQLAQFNMVEQQTNTNKWLEQIATGQGMGGSGGSGGLDASYLGKTVTLNQNVIAFNGAVNNFDVSLAGNASQTYVVIRDGEGTPVRTMTLGAKSAGTHAVQWDGKDDLGQSVAMGSYSIEVMASDQGGNNIPSIVQRTGIVEAVRFTDTGVQLVVGGSPANSSDIVEIRL